MKISIIIPVYNGAEYIEQRFKELIAYDDPEAEFIFIDDGSTDKSFAMMNRCKNESRYNNISVITYGENKGQMYARLFGVGLAKYKDILMTDIDDPFSFSYLEGLRFDLDAEPEQTIITIPKQIFVDGKPNGQVWRVPQYENPEQYIVAQFINHSGLVAVNNTILDRNMIREALTETRQLLKAIGVNRIDYAEDSLTANVMIHAGLIKHVKPSTMYSVPYTSDNSDSMSKDRSRIMRYAPVLIAHAYYQIFSQYSDEDDKLKAEMRQTFEDICRNKYGKDADVFMKDVDMYVERMKSYYHK